MAGIKVNVSEGGASLSISFGGGPKGFKFPLVISTSIKAKALMGNKTNNINKYLNNILSF